MAQYISYKSMLQKSTKSKDGTENTEIMYHAGYECILVLCV